MALIVVKDLAEVYELVRHEKTVKAITDAWQVQYEFCRNIEGEKLFEIPFLENEEITEYFNNVGIRYKGNYVLESNDWGNGRKGEQFVTHLYYSLQLSCLMLFYPNVAYVLVNARLYELKYMLPVLRKRDIFIQLDTYMSVQWLIKTVKAGIEVQIAGKSSKDMSENEMDEFLWELEEHASWLNREVDAQVFPEDYKERYIRKQEKKEMSVLEYIRKKYPGDDIDSLISSYEYVLEEVPVLADIRLKVNGENFFDEKYRRYPIHYLFLIDGKWKYINENSVKWPNFMELFYDALLTPKVYDVNVEKEADVTRAVKVFAMILNCDEICDVSRYWENVALLLKYDKKKKEVEICDQATGILEFHELLQQSVDLCEKEEEN